MDDKVEAETRAPLRAAPPPRLVALDGRPNPKIAVQALVEPNGDWAKIVVLDNGPGIPPEGVEDIFKPFVSTKGSRGTGLGLPVSRKILRALPERRPEPHRCK